MYKVAYYIPTHRILGENMTGFCEEVRFAQKKYNLRIPFVVVDGLDDERNINVIRKYKKEYEDITFLYVNKVRLKAIFQDIEELLKDNATAKNAIKYMYPSNNLNYGNAYNNIYVLGMLLGNDIIIRRDSDVHIQKILDNNTKYLFPIELELDNLSKKFDGKTAYVVGGGYSGKYGLDIDDLIIDGDYKLVKDLFSCLLIPKEEHDEIINLEIINNDNYKKDSILFNSAAYPDCGNCAYYKIFEYLPCSPVDYTIGTDYFLLEISLKLELCIGYHNRSVYHKYTADRYDTFDKRYNYWKGIALLIDLKVIYKNFYKNLVGLGKNVRGDLENITDIVYTELNTFKNSIGSYRKLREEKFSDFITILKSSGNVELIKVADKLKENFDNIMKHTELGIGQHLELLNSWQDITSAIKRLKNKSQDYFIELVKSN